MRNFRLFAYENFFGRSKAYISDRLDEKIYEYEQTCRKHGFELIASPISTLLDSNSFVGISCIIAASVLSGNWQFAVATAIGGAVIETSKLIVNVATQRRSFQSYMNNHELAYLFHLENNLKCK